MIGLVNEDPSGGTIGVVINPVLTAENPTTQNTTISSSDGTLTITTTGITADGSGSPTTTSTVVPTTQVEETALADIAARITAFKNTVNQRGDSLQASDLMPYIDPGYLDSGRSGASWAQRAASEMKGATVSFSGLQIKSLDTGSNVANVSFVFSQDTQSETVETNFRRLNGTWYVSGNNQVAGVNVMTRAWDYGPSYATFTSTRYQKSTALVVEDVQQDNVLSATVAGPGITGAVDVPMVCDYLQTDGLATCGNSHGSSDTQRYFEYDFSYWPAVGDQYTFTLTTKSGGPYTYTATVGNEYGFEADGGTPVAADYPVITLTNPSSLSFSDLTSGPTVVTGTVYLPIWCATGGEMLHFNLQAHNGASNNVTNIDIFGTLTGTPVPGQTNPFTMTIPQVTINYSFDCGEGSTCYNVTFSGQTGDVEPGGWFGFDANSHATGFATSGKQIQ
jgi:hypothetical protein